MNITVQSWVAQSPDLNPIEHLWDYLGRVVNEMCPTSFPDLKDNLFSVWKGIQPEITEKIVDSLPHVCARSLGQGVGPQNTEDVTSFSTMH